MYEYTNTGMKYTSYLMGSRGAGFILFPDPEHNSQQITAAIAELRATRDLIRVRIATEDDRDFIYMREIFRQPGVPGLRWYQINTDAKLIRRERLKGTSPKKYADTYVLPFIEQTEERYRNALGDDIYEI